MRIIGVSGSGSGLLLTCIVSQVFGQCLSTPITMRAGVKPGINICSYDPGDGSSTFNGVGVHAGLGMGVDFYRVLGLDFVPQYRTTAFGRDELLREHNYFYNGIMFPIHLSLKGGMIPVVSPYVGLGIGFNFLVSGV